MISSIDFDTTFIGNLIKETENLATGLKTLTKEDIYNYFSDVNKKYNLLKTTGDKEAYLYDKEAYLYDIIVILKFYAIIHRLFWYHFNTTLKSNENDFFKFIKDAKLKFTSDGLKCRIEGDEIILNKLFILDSLKLNEDNDNYNTIYNIEDAAIIVKYDETFKNVPLYHKFDKDTKIFTKFQLLYDFMTNDYNNIYIIKIDHKSSNQNRYDINKINKINKILVENAIFTTTKINEYYNRISNIDYQTQRIKLYLYVFNDILNLNNKNINDFLSSIKLQMYRYNKILYNALIQYGNTKNILNDIKGFNDNLEYIISNNSNNSNPNKKNKNNNANNNIEIINTYNDKLNFNDYLLTFQEVSDKYKNEWKIYNKGLYYYRILLFISIILFISIVIISNININHNTIILIFIIKILIILCLILFIYKKPKKEHFTMQSSDVHETLDFLMQNEKKALSDAKSAEELKHNAERDLNEVNTETGKEKRRILINAIRQRVEKARQNKDSKEQIEHEAIQVYDSAYSRLTVMQENIVKTNYFGLASAPAVNRLLEELARNFNIDTYITNKDNAVRDANAARDEFSAANSELSDAQDIVNIVNILTQKYNNADIDAKKKRTDATNAINARINAEKKLNDIYNLYKLRIIKYDLIVLSNQSNSVSSKFNEYISNLDNAELNDYILNLNFDATIINDYNEKLEYYKVKSIDLYNSITTLKKTNVINYYIILIIYVSFIFMIIGLICLMLYPNNLYSIIISLSIIFIITLIILFVKLHKNTNMDNDKNYWSNFNPSDNLTFNDDGLT